MTAKRRGEGYLLQLDALRALAVTAVIYQHCGNKNLAGLLRPGYFGVRLFFVISGFLITGILLRAKIRAEATMTTRTSVIRSFYIRRFLRIFPAYYFVLAVATVLALPTVRETFAWHVTYMSNYYYAKLGDWSGPVSHFWSLAVEEQFYFLWPFVIVFTPARYLLRVLVGVMVLAPLTRWLLISLTTNAVTMSTPLSSCSDSLAAGAFLAWLWHTKAANRSSIRRTTRGLLVIGAGLGIALLLLGWLDLGWRLRLALTDTAALLVFVWLVNRTAEGWTGLTARVLEVRPLVYTGTISYGIYLFHNLIGALATKAFPPGPLLNLLTSSGNLQFVSIALVTVAIASISWYALERPLNDLKDRFPYAAGSPVSAGERTVAPTAFVGGGGA